MTTYETKPDFHAIEIDAYKTFCNLHKIDMTKEELRAQAKIHAKAARHQAITDFYRKQREQIKEDFLKGIQVTSSSEQVNADLKRVVSNREYQAVVNLLYSSPLPTNILECLNIAVQLKDQPIACWLGRYISHDKGFKI